MDSHFRGNDSMLKILRFAQDDGVGLLHQCLGQAHHSPTIPRPSANQKCEDKPSYSSYLKHLPFFAAFGCSRVKFESKA
jgi:hypothetical protein